MVSITFYPIIAVTLRVKVYFDDGLVSIYSAASEGLSRTLSYGQQATRTMSWDTVPFLFGESVVHSLSGAFLSKFEG